MQKESKELLLQVQKIAAKEQEALEEKTED